MMMLRCPAMEINMAYLQLYVYVCVLSVHMQTGYDVKNYDLTKFSNTLQKSPHNLSCLFLFCFYDVIFLQNKVRQVCLAKYRSQSCCRKETTSFSPPSLFCICFCLSNSVKPRSHIPPPPTQTHDCCPHTGASDEHRKLTHSNTVKSLTMHHHGRLSSL